MRWLALALLFAATCASAQPAPAKPDCTSYPNLAPFIPGCKDFVTTQPAAPLAPVVPPPSFGEMQKALTSWATAYFACASASVSVLDDGRSDANTVATGLGSRCAAGLPPLVDLMGPDRATGFIEKLRPGLIEIVLTNRVKANAKTTGPKTRQM